MRKCIFMRKSSIKCFTVYSHLKAQKRTGVHNPLKKHDMILVRENFTFLVKISQCIQ